VPVGSDQDRHCHGWPGRAQQPAAGPCLPSVAAPPATASWQVAGRKRAPFPHAALSTQPRKFISAETLCKTTYRQGNSMKNKLKLAVVGVGLAVVSAAGVGTAFASTSAPSTPAAVQAPTAAVDTPTAGDTVDAPGAADVQQGNQSTPDTAGAGAEKAGTESPEAPGSEKGSVSDGPGGFADQGGSNTNTQQQGNNQPASRPQTLSPSPASRRRGSGTSQSLLTEAIPVCQGCNPGRPQETCWRNPPSSDHLAGPPRSRGQNSSPFSNVAPPRTRATRYGASQPPSAPAQTPSA